MMEEKMPKVEQPVVYSVGGKACSRQPCSLRHLHDHERSASIAKDRDALRDSMVDAFANNRKLWVRIQFEKLGPLQAAHMAQLIHGHLWTKYDGPNGSRRGITMEFIAWLAAQADEEAMARH